MPIQLNITQDSGVTATYHIVKDVRGDFTAGSCQVSVHSFLDQAHSTGAELSWQMVDISPLLAAPVAATSLVGQIEAYIIAAVPAFAGGVQIE